MTRRGGASLPRYKKGLRYEKKALDFLEKQLSALGTFIREPCFRFFDGIRTRFCYPDALLLLPNRCALLIEVKTRHTYDAWWQLCELYAPVVRKALGLELRLLEVTAAFDPGVRLPQRRVLETVEEAIGHKGYGVFIWTGR